jgi:hypothetical protein
MTLNMDDEAKPPIDHAELFPRMTAPELLTTMLRAGALVYRARRGELVIHIPGRLGDARETMRTAALLKAVEIAALLTGKGVQAPCAAGCGWPVVHGNTCLLCVLTRTPRP